MLAITTAIARANDLFINPAGTNVACTSVQSAIDVASSGAAVNRTRIFVTLSSVYARTPQPAFDSHQWRSAGVRGELEHGDS